MRMQIDFNDSKKPNSLFILHEHIIYDRGSKYSVCYGKVESRSDIKIFLQTLKKNKKYRTATHNSWAARITHEGAVYETKNDDDETGAGILILRVMQRENVTDCVICVTRWFGGVKLMGDRFKHVQDAAMYAIADFEEEDEVC